MSPDARDMFARTAAANSSRSSLSQYSLADERYPLQVRALIDMGFTDLQTNQAVLAATSGNLQQAIEALLAGKVGRTSFGESSNVPKKSTSAAEDLIGVFDAPQSSPIASPTTQYNSLLDMDAPLDVQPEKTENGYKNNAEELAEEFDEFASAPTASTKQTRASTSSEPSRRSFDMGSKSLKLGAMPSDPALSNPWASSHLNSNGHESSADGHAPSNAFDDIFSNPFDDNSDKQKNKTYQ